MKRLSTSLILALCLGALSAWAQAVPQRISFTGNLANASGPLTGAHAFTFALFDAATAGNQAWTESYAALTATNGLVYADLGSTTALTPTIFNGAALWLDITVDGVHMTPRLAIDSVPYALRAAVANSAETLGTLLPGDVQRRVTQSCLSGIAAIDAAGGVVCAAPPTTVSSLLASTGGGLQVSAATGAVSVGLQTCATGLVLKSTGTGWSCQADQGLTGISSFSFTTSVAAGVLTLTPTFGTGTGTFTQGNDARLPPAPGIAGRLLYDNGSGWAPVPPGAAGSILVGGLAPQFVPTTNITSVGTLASLTVQGSVQASSFVTSPSRVYVVAVPAASFTPMDSATTIGSNWGGGNDRYISTSTGAGTLQGPVPVPNGATITGIACKVVDNDPAGYLTVYLVDNLQNFAPCNASTTGANGQVQTLNLACTVLVDNVNAMYTLRYGTPTKCGTNGSTCSIYGCSISYTLPSL